MVVVFRIGLCFLIVFGSLQSKAVDVTFRSLREIVEERNAKISGQKQLFEAAKTRSGVYKRSYWPKVSVEVGYEAFEVGTTVSDQQPFYGLLGTVNVYNGGRDQQQESVQGLKAEIESQQLKVVLAETLGKARELYWRIVYLQSEKELLQKSVDINKKNLGSANRRIQAGVATPSDRLDFQLKTIELQREIVNVEAEKKALSYDLLIYLGYDADEPLNVKGHLVHYNEWESDLKHTHEDHEFFVKPSKLKAQVLGLHQKQKSNAWLPKVDVYAGWQQNNQREEDPVEARERQEAFVGIRATVKLFDGFSSSNEARALSSEAKALEAQSAFQERKNEAHIKKEFLELRTLHEQVHVSEKHIQLAEKYYDATQREYARGVKNSPDVLGASERLENATRTKNGFLRDFHIARSYVLSKIGR